MEPRHKMDDEVRKLFVALGPAYNEHVVGVFALLARRHMLDRWPANCCIQATRTTILVLAHFGISAVPFPCMMCVENMAGKVAKMVGFSEETRRAINEKHNPAPCARRRMVRPPRGHRGRPLADRRLL